MESLFILSPLPAGVFNVVTATGTGAEGWSSTQALT